MRICVSTANLGEIDHETVRHTLQSMPDTWQVDYFSYTDDNFAPRLCAMHPRLQAKIPKMLAHETHPGYDYYVWIDGSIALADKDALSWLIGKCEGFDMASALFPHPAARQLPENWNTVFLKWRRAINTSSTDT